MVQFRQMEYFVAVAEERQFSKAAVRLGVGQSTVSEQIRSLEQQLGAELFLRTSRSVTLTPAGWRFWLGAGRFSPNWGIFSRPCSLMRVGNSGVCGSAPWGPR